MTAGENDGALIIPADDSSIPGIYVGCLNSRVEDGGWSFGSGTFIGQRVFLSCAHNFFSGGNKGHRFVTSTNLYLKFKNDGETNENLVDTEITTKTVLPWDLDGFVRMDGKLNYYDISIVITKTPYSIISGEEPAKISEFDVSKQIPVRTFGYPGDMSNNPIFEVVPEPLHLHYSPGLASYDSKNNICKTTGEGAAGMSGGGVFDEDNNVIGVNVAGTTTSTDILNTIFIPLRTQLYRWVKSILESNKINGWYVHNGKKYYFKNDIMYKNTTKTIGGKIYTFDENGIVTSEKSSNYYTQSGPGIMTVYDFNILNGTTKISIPTFEDPPDIQYFDFQIYPYGNKNNSIWKRVFLEKSKYIVKIDINEFNNLRSKYVIQAYATTKTKPRIDAGRLILDFNLESSGLVDIRTYPDAIFVDVNNISNKNVQEILATVWTDNYGQDDIKWYQLNKHDDIYRLMLRTNEYDNGTKLNIHVHAKLGNTYLGLGNKYIIIGG